MSPPSMLAAPTTARPIKWRSTAVCVFVILAQHAYMLQADPIIRRPVLAHSNGVLMASHGTIMRPVALAIRPPAAQAKASAGMADSGSPSVTRISANEALYRRARMGPIGPPSHLVGSVHPQDPHHSPTATVLPGTVGSGSPPAHMVIAPHPSTHYSIVQMA